MGPYCKFCGTRCFCYFPNETPQYILDAYGSSTIIATCRAGQNFEKGKVGYCYDEIISIIRDAEQRDAPTEAGGGELRKMDNGSIGSFDWSDITDETPRLGG